MICYVGGGGNGGDDDGEGVDCGGEIRDKNGN